MTFFAVEDYLPMSRGRCARCRKIANRAETTYLCQKCTRWTDGGSVGPIPLARELAEPYRLQDPGYVEDEDPRELEEIITDALDTPEIQEALDFTDAHRHRHCEHYGKCLNMAIFHQWFFFSCTGCALFGKK